MSILTAGNSQASGFANVGHVDGDQLDHYLHIAALCVLKKIANDETCNNSGNKKILEHLRKIYNKHNTFHVCTTCGYKMSLKDKNKVPLAFFLLQFFESCSSDPTRKLLPCFWWTYGLPSNYLSPNF